MNSISDGEMRRLRFAGVEITPATIQKTREHYADLCRQSVVAAAFGEFYVNDIQRYVAWQTQMIEASLSGEHDHTLSFMQRAHWIQTGECIPLLAPTQPAKGTR